MVDGRYVSLSPANAGVHSEPQSWAPAFAGEGMEAKFTLSPHNDHPSRSVMGVTASVRRAGDALLLRYRIEGQRILWPAIRPPVRADDLWRTTCFELFLRFDDQRYVEFNFSPSSRWAAYAFDGHRERRAELARDVPPRIQRRHDGIEVDCELSGLPGGDLRMALSAVIEEEGDVLSYWALAHPPGTPDFHHAACFAARLPAPAVP